MELKAVAETESERVDEVETETEELGGGGLSTLGVVDVKYKAVGTTPGTGVPLTSV